MILCKIKYSYIKQSDIFVKTIKVLIAILTLLSASIFAQTYGFYIPLEVQKAYSKHTRTLDGTPGNNYWQNRSEYKILVKLDTLNYTLFGSETIRYFNNSPDTLDQIIIRLYQDVNKIGNARDYDTPKADINDGMNITHIALNNKDVTNIDSLDRYGTNLYLPLSGKLNPAQSISLAIEWNYQLATESPLRGSGKCGENTYFISYWYPQVAVYDDISGWDEYEYKGMAEFYNDFSDYEVRIEVPKEYVVWSTGMLQNPREVLSKTVLDRYYKGLTSDEIVSVVDVDSRRAGRITADNDTNTWYYKAENIPDFSFGTSGDFVWDLTSLVVDKGTGRRTIICAAYNNTSKQMSEATEICRKTIEYLSNELPGIPYPFPSMTIFQGTSAMEYPMMVNIREYSESLEWLFMATLIHEVVHSYFPFYMGTNERKYAFMDEGWAHMLPMDFQTQEIRKIRENFDARRWNNIGNYEEYAGMEKYDKPPTVLTADASLFDYHVSNHNRPAAAYYFLQDLLGEELFKTALQEFMHRWNYKHPVPCDFFSTFNQVVGYDLSWYWKPWFFEFGYPDLAIEKLINEPGNRKVLIKKKGNIPIPIQILVNFADGSEITIYKTARVWEKGESVYSVLIPGKKKIKRIELGNRVIPDVDRSDNIIQFE
jgi:hypothetical protein